MFRADQWADPVFLTFIKEYWEYNYRIQREKIGNVAFTLVIQVIADGQSVKEDILTSLEIVNGTLMPWVEREKKLVPFPNGVFITGSPAAWSVVSKTMKFQDIDIQESISQGPNRMKSLRIVHDMMLLAHRVGERLAAGVRPTLDVKNSVKIGGSPPSLLGSVKLADWHKSIQRPEGGKLHVKIGGLNFEFESKTLRKDYISQYLQELRAGGSQSMKKFWAEIEALPDDIGNKDILSMPNILLVFPTFKIEMLTLRRSANTDESAYAVVVSFLEDFLKTEQEVPAAPEFIEVYGSGTQPIPASNKSHFVPAPHVSGFVPVRNAPLPSSVKTCPLCDAQVPSNMKVCSKCGYTFAL